MNLATYLDSTYLKTPEQSGLTEEETRRKVFGLADEAIENQIYAVMIRPEYVRDVKDHLDEKKAAVKVGTVIGFHEGTASVESKMAEAEKAIADGADDLDFVVNFEAYKNEQVELVKDEFLKGSKLALSHDKTVKWIIEIAALTDEQIIDLTQKLAQWADEHFSAEEQHQIFVKSSTGFYQTTDGKPNGATLQAIQLMKAHAGNLEIKAAGGVKNQQDAEAMIAAGVSRIGTSSASALLSRQQNLGGY